MNTGSQNEREFVKLFNRKRISEFEEREIKFLEELFEKNIDKDEEILCWKNKMAQKADIFIKYKNYVKKY